MEVGGIHLAAILLTILIYRWTSIGISIGVGRNLANSLWVVTEVKLNDNCQMTIAKLRRKRFVHIWTSPKQKFASFY